MTRATSTTLNVILERRMDDYWNLEGNRDLPDSWTGFTRFTISDEQTPDGYTWSVERLTKKQTSVSHCSTESEIISLDAGLRMDATPALDLLDLVLESCILLPANLRNPKENVQGHMLHQEPS